MATVKHPEKQVEFIQVLNGRTYDEIRKKKVKTLEIHLTSSLFPAGKVTSTALKNVIARKAPVGDPYNVVFHFGSKKKIELTDKLEKARKRLSSTGKNWYIMLTHTDRASEEVRVKKIVPKGTIKSSVIDAALSDQSDTTLKTSLF